MLVQSLGWEDSLEEGMATHSSILPGESHGQRSLGAVAGGVVREWATAHSVAESQAQLKRLSMHTCRTTEKEAPVHTSIPNFGLYLFCQCCVGQKSQD